MGTTTLHISLPESLKKYVKDRVKAEHYSNPSDFIREDQKRCDEERLERMLLEGLESGPGKRMTSKEWQKLRDEVEVRIKNNKEKA